MADVTQAIAKVTEIATNIKKLVQDYVAKSGNKQFTLANIVPGWDKLDDKLRDLIGLEFKDRIVKKGAADIVEVGKSEDGSDLYELKQN